MTLRKPSYAVSLFACCLLASIVSIANAAFAVVAPYENRADRQKDWLEGLREAFDPDFAYTLSNEFGVNGQLVAMTAELEWQVRGLVEAQAPYFAHQPLTTLDTHLRDAVIRLRVLVDPANECVDDLPLGCTGNRVIAWRSVFLAAYLLAKYEEVDSVDPWTQPTRDAARALFRDPHLSHKSYGLNNATLPQVGARLMGGKALGDSELLERGITELTHAYDEDIRRGVAETLSVHYTGPTLAETALLIEGLGPICTVPCAGSELNEVRQRVSNFMDLLLLAVGHQYLPGGGVGLPQDRKSSGAVADKDPTDGDHLVQTIHTLLYDPDLEGSAVTFVRRLAGITYQPKEIIRSIFLDKGNGYTFWRRGRAAYLKCCGGNPGGVEAYPLGIDGVRWDYHANKFVSGPMPVVPLQLVMLPNGHGVTGIRYGSGTNSELSSGTYLRDPVGSVQASTADLGFAILHQRQPKNGFADVLANPSPDPTWSQERHTPYRRMMLGGTTISLWDSKYVAAGIPVSIHDFTQVHLPDFSGEDPDEAVDVACGDGWRVIGVKDRSWLGFLPLAEDPMVEQSVPGPHDPNPNKAGDEQGGDWTYLELSSPVYSNASYTGGVTVLEPGAAYDVPETHATMAAAASAFCTDLAARDVDFDPSAGSVELGAVDANGVPVTMKLEYAGEVRSLQYGTNDPVVQSDEDFLDHGMLYSEWVGDPGSSVSFDETTYELTVARTGYPNDLVLYLGPEGADTGVPTAPGIVEIRWDLTNPSQTGFQWSARPWDDEGVSHYEVWRGEPDTPTGTLLHDTLSATASGFVDVHGDPNLSRCALQVHPNAEEEVLYTLWAVDNDDKRSVNHARLLVPEDAQPPSTPASVTAQGSTGEVVLSWNAATDECGVYGYHILRREGPDPAPFEIVGFSQQTTWTDDWVCLNPGLEYTYEVQAIDTAPNWGVGAQDLAEGLTQQESAPGGVSALTGGGVVAIWWNGVTAPCIGYEIERVSDGATFTTANLYYLDTTPDPGPQTYRVRIVTDWNPGGPWSAETAPVVVE